MKDNKTPITVYYSEATSANRGGEWSFLYPKPKTLYHELLQDKSSTSGPESLFACPAANVKYKNILVFKNTMSCSYEFDYTDENSQDSYIKNTTPNSIQIEKKRPAALKFGPSLELALNYLLFADEPLMASFTPPFFHKPEYTKYGAVIPGEFDIGQWYRTFNMEVQMWSNKGEFHLKEDEPLFYVELKTDRPIILKRFKANDYLCEVATEAPSTRSLFGDHEGLPKRYKRFRDVGLREKILTEIKKNLIDEH
jgi:hypothetical protein